ncbi:MAG: flagellar biosynthesis protein FlgJ [Micavibrio aeruginosavorus]|uniref:Flagellar biosynthesis protein FlgJ n=1 Tax=Micavibrio aeruginosavorus TaxID=349221 RepID=A0A7T5R3J9_9BACT|nr:MAG: flagellar biosynthesis protein FlgJ [Micavibrio aeruginosavorus]
MLPRKNDYGKSGGKLAHPLLIQGEGLKTRFEVISMNSAGNILKNNTLAALQRKASPEVLGAIKKASARTGVDFAYLLEKASAESSFKTDIKSKSSSATGLYQFIEKTWLGMIRDHGAKYGLGDYADKIGADGKVSDAQTRKDILALRNDPDTAAAMAAEYAAANKRYLEKNVDGTIGSVELYFAHFMGPSGASGFLNAMKDNPLQTAADLFPQAARANRNVFYDSKTGQPRTLAGVYDFFARKFGNSADSAAMVAEAKAAPAARVSADMEESAEIWAQNLFRSNQQQQIRLLAGTDDHNDEQPLNRTAKLLGGIPHSGGTSNLAVSPLQIMELAQLDTPLDTPRSRPRYNE